MYVKKEIYGHVCTCVYVNVNTFRKEVHKSFTD